MRHNDFYKILVIRLSSLGDIILTTPLLKILRKHLLQAQIDYCTKKSYSDIIRYNIYLNNVIEFEDKSGIKELKHLRKKIRDERYDLIIDLHNNLRTFYLKLFLRFSTRILVLKKYSFRKFLLVKFKINLMRDLQDISHRYINVLLKIMKIPIEDKYQPEIFTNEKSKENSDKYFNELKIPHDTKLICIAPTSKHFTKTYPSQYFIELINKFDREKYYFILTGLGEDYKITDNIKSKTGDNVINLCDKLNLFDLAEILKKCSVIICGDTGPMHIAEAVNTPIIMLAGSSVKEFGFYPETKNSKVLEINGLSCRPCSHIGKDHCPKGHFRCMKEIKPDAIFAETQSILNNYL